jgi:hypothetical protein
MFGSVFWFKLRRSEQGQRRTEKLEDELGTELEQELRSENTEA